MAGRNSLVVKGAVEPRQKIWETIRLLGDNFTVNDLTRRSGQIQSQIRAYLQALTKAGVVEQIDPSPTTRVVGQAFRLIQDEGAEHPRLDSNGQRTHAHLLTENIWRSLRILKGSLTIADIAYSSSTETVSANLLIVGRYLEALIEAGYVAKTLGDPPRTPHTYCLIPTRYTGPKPPQIHSFQRLQVFDPNISKLVYDSALEDQLEEDDSTWNNPEFQRLRGLLADWISEAESQGTHADLVKRTKFELATPVNGGTLQ